jgi:hypothetical protein
VTTIIKRLRHLDGERRFHLAMAAAMLAAVFIGFGPTYYLRPFVPPVPGLLPTTPLVHLHGAIFTAWLLLFVVQTGLVSSGRFALHRWAGPVALALVVAMIVVAALAALYEVPRRTGADPLAPLVSLAVPLLTIPFFAGLILAALHFRRHPATHKRLMLFAMIVLMVPATVRIALIYLRLPVEYGLVPLPALFVLAMIVRDLASLGRLHRATTWAAPIVLFSFVLPLLVGETHPWQTFARWAASLVG